MIRGQRRGREHGRGGMGHDNAHSVGLPSSLVAWTTKIVGGRDEDDIAGRRDVGEEIAGGQHGKEDITTGIIMKKEDIPMKRRSPRVG